MFTNRRSQLTGCSNVKMNCWKRRRSHNLVIISGTSQAKIQQAPHKQGKYYRTISMTMKASWPVYTPTTRRKWKRPSNNLIKRVSTNVNTGTWLMERKNLSGQGES